MGKQRFGRPSHMVSAYLDEETYRKAKESHITFSHLIALGLKSTKIQQDFNFLMLQFEDLRKKQARTAELLGKYAGNSEIE
jgi:arginine/lysine/ornithine decarboxylase